MKHAVLILAHKNYPLLCRLIRYFAKDCEVFVHVDKKSKFTKDEIGQLYEYDSVKAVVQKYDVHWGGFSMLKVELYLLRLAMKQSDAAYFHLISGQDYPVKPLPLFLAFFEKNKGKIYLDYKHIPFVGRDYNGFYRFQYYMPYDYIDGRSPKGKRIIYKFYVWHKRLHIKRRIPDQFYHLYGGSQWFSITREAADVLVGYTRKHPAFYRRMRFTFAPEESYVTTVLVNKMPGNLIVNNNLRYVRWMCENGNNPSNLGKEHFEGVVKSTAFFARKMESPYYEPLTMWIDRYLLSDHGIRFLENGVWVYRSLNMFRYDASLAKTMVLFCRLAGVVNVVDAGCGCGMYVAALRKNDIPVVGFDGNPYTQELVTSLYPMGLPCIVADLTDELETDGTPFDLAVCLDVLPYINREHENQVLANLVGLTKRYILLSWPAVGAGTLGYVSLRPAEYVVRRLEEFGYKKSDGWTDYFCSSASLPDYKTSLFLFEKTGIDLK